MENWKNPLLVYAVSNGRQGFFNLETGKYVPVSKPFFKKWKKIKETWWYTLGVIRQNGPQLLIEMEATKAWNQKVTPEQHFGLCKEEFQEILDSKEGVMDILHLIAFPKSKEPDEIAINRIIGILGGEYDT